MAIKRLLKILPHLKHVATLPCEIQENVAKVDELMPLSRDDHSSAEFALVHFSPRSWFEEKSTEDLTKAVCC